MFFSSALAELPTELVGLQRLAAQARCFPQAMPVRPESKELPSSRQPLNIH